MNVSSEINIFYSQITPPAQHTAGALDAVLKNLDPSLFQNITLGILAISIPFAIVFLTDILNRKKEKRGEFEQMVLNDEVWGTKKLFWLSVSGIIFFAFFAGKDISNLAKLIAIISAIILVLVYWSSFKRLLRFSEGYKPEFEIPFLKKLGFSKFLKFKNKAKTEKIFRLWNSFWSMKTETNERDFTTIFIAHIDDAIKFGKFDHAIQLAQVYTNNIEKRNHFSIGYEILPKVFEWNEIFWNRRYILLKKYNTEKVIQDFFSKNNFLIYKNLILKIYRKFNLKNENFWNWHYFVGEFFQALIRILLTDEHGAYQLFSSFKKCIEISKEKLEEITNIKEKEKYLQYINQLFSSFCPIFFSEINKAPSKYAVWEQHFPTEWKITITNKNNRIARIILHEFLKWSTDRILKIEDKENFDEDLIGVVGKIFPNIHPILFRAFLMLYVSNDVKYAIEKEPNFYILSLNTIGFGSINESEEERGTRISETIKIKDASQKEETIQIILEFFHFWSAFKISKDNLSEGEFKNWESYSEEQRKTIVTKVRKEKLEKIKLEIESEEIKNICEVSERKELRRKDFLELINLLLLEIKK